MIDTNFDNVDDVVVGNDGIVHETKVSEAQLDMLLEQEMDSQVWKKIARLAVMQIELGLKESLKSGIYNDQVVKTAMAAMKQAGKTFDEDAAKDLADSLASFRNATKKKADAHKKEAIQATMN